MMTLPEERDYLAIGEIQLGKSTRRDSADVAAWAYCIWLRWLLFRGQCGGGRDLRGGLQCGSGILAGNS